MEYISTRNSEKIFSFKDVFLKGLASDGGLFVPKSVPNFTSQEMLNLRNLSYNDLACEIITKFCGSEFSKKEIKELVEDSYKDFRIKNVVGIKKLAKINLLELFYGPTLAFKDIALQVIGNMYDKILEKNNSKINIIVATSGDTGAAAISAIRNKKNIKIFVLHPYGKISDIQRRFMTTIDADNVFNIAIEGNFDDCQKFVKDMFSDASFNSSINMSGVNSINWSRIIIQIVYYFFSYFKVSHDGDKINYSVPTGNFGDIYAGYIAKKMGLPINKLIVATNKNDILKRVINTGSYKPLKVAHTVSPSMDIQVASNFERLIFDVCSQNSKRLSELMNDLKEKGEFNLNSLELNKIKEDFISDSLSEKETKLIIKNMYKDENMLIDPHTAVGIGVANKLSLDKKNVVLATAHPSKFPDVIKSETGSTAELPENLKIILDKKENYKKMPKDLENLKKYILEKI